MPSAIFSDSKHTNKNPLSFCFTRDTPLDTVEQAAELLSCWPPKAAEGVGSGGILWGEVRLFGLRQKVSGVTPVYVDIKHVHPVCRADVAFLLCFSEPLPSVTWAVTRAAFYLCFVHSSL